MSVLTDKKEYKRRVIDKSIDTYYEALDVAEDTTFMQKDSLLQMLISDRILLSENGKNMAAFAGNPVVVAKHKFSTEDFFLYYPLPDRSWRKNPNQLDTMPGTRFSEPCLQRGRSLTTSISGPSGRESRNS